MAGQGRPAGINELARPALEIAPRIGIDPLDRTRDVGQLLREIGEGIMPRPRIDLAAGLFVLRAVDGEYAFEPQRGRRSGERGERHAIVEHVVEPADAARPRLDRQFGLDQPLVVAVARAQHQAMLAQFDRLRVAVSRQVADAQGRLFALHVAYRLRFCSRAWLACRPGPSQGPADARTRAPLTFPLFTASMPIGRPL